MARFKMKWNQVVLGLILLVSAFLNVYALNREGYGNDYYAAAIKSMVMNWHNFFFNSFDPNGFITIDKPPVDFWIQALFVKVFGFHGWAMLLPQAIAGVCSVALLYHLVRRIFGVVAAIIAAAVLALTPIAVAVQRTNEVDGLLVFVMLLAAWSLLKAMETRKLRWLIWVGVFEGVGFNIKMLEAYLILPAIYLVYIVGAKVNWKKKIGHLAAMTAVLVVLSFSWAAAVDFTPASERPYVGSTENNSEISLAFGYNGLHRLTGNMSIGPSAQTGSKKTQMPNFQSGVSGNSAPQGATGGTKTQSSTASKAKGTANSQGSGGFTGGPSGNFGGKGQGSFGQGQGQSSSGASQWQGRFGQGKGGFPASGQSSGGSSGMFDTGTPGVLRLFQSSLSDQISWLLPIALLAVIPLLRRVRWRRPWTRRELGTLFWIAWLLPMVVFFSIAGFFHQYYLITLAPAIAALTGAGLVKMWKDLRGKGIWRYALPVVMLVDLGFEWGIVKNYPTVRTGLLIGSIGAAALAALFIWRGQRKHSKRIGVIFGVLSLLVAPGYWALTPILDGVNASMPAAGPQSSSFGGGMGNMTMSNQTTGTSDSALIAYLEKHYKASQGSYLVATQNADTAAPIIIATGLPVMAMGGFNGSDPAITVKKLEQLTKSGKLKYFLLQTGGFGGGGQAGQNTATDASARTSAAQGNSSSASGKKSAVTGMPTMLGDGNAGEAFSAFGGAGGMGGSQSAITKWITAHCKVVSSSAWESTTATTSSSGHNMGGGGTLYEYVGS